MNKLLSVFIVIIPVLFIATACYRAPDFPEVPEISFNDIKFYDTPSQDSLVLTINFQDGDGDLGLRGHENDQPFNPYFFIFEGGRPLMINSNDTMPPFTRPYSCINYKLGKIDNNTFINYYTEQYRNIFSNQQPDTFYTEPNLFTDNFLIDFFVKRNGSYEEFNWVTAPSTGCGESMNGRFSPLFDPESPNKPISGTLTYAMENFGFVPYFRNDTLKLQIRIIDRALNISNTIETPEFTLREITVNN